MGRRSTSSLRRAIPPPGAGFPLPDACPVLVARQDLHSYVSSYRSSVTTETLMMVSITGVYVMKVTI